MDTTRRNYVDDYGQAHIDGKTTALAGCDSECDKNCIRKDTRLKYRWELKKAEDCRLFWEVKNEPRNND